MRRAALFESRRWDWERTSEHGLRAVPIGRCILLPTCWLPMQNRQHLRSRSSESCKWLKLSSRESAELRKMKRRWNQRWYKDGRAGTWWERTACISWTSINRARAQCFLKDPPSKIKARLTKNGPKLRYKKNSENAMRHDIGFNGMFSWLVFTFSSEASLPSMSVTFYHHKTIKVEYLRS